MQTGIYIYMNTILFTLFILSMHVKYSLETSRSLSERTPGQVSTRPAESAFYSIIMIFMGNTPWADLCGQLPVQEIPGPLDECYIGT